MNSTWQALAKEAGLAAEHLALGATALGRANYAQKAHYSQAFFALTIGLERSAKLALVVDHAISHGGSFPTARSVRKHGHDLRSLLDFADDIAAQFQSQQVTSDRLPRGPIHNEIVSILTDFADNVTRYFNLDFVTGGSATDVQDPIEAWNDRVIAPVLEKHLSERKARRIRANAEAAAVMMEPFTLVRHHSESGEELNTVFDASLQTGLLNAATPYCRMYVMQIMRFFSHLMSDLTYASHVAQLEEIPSLSEFYRVFNNDDAYFRRRKTWRIE